ncbi:MAG: peroxidase [Planctomycetales bacterium]|nr:peroxidase [Planctomycetales bacterium]
MRPEKQPGHAADGPRARKRGFNLRSQRRLRLESCEERLLMAADFRAIDGGGNNLLHADWGQAGTQLLRQTTVDYADGISSPAGADRPSARTVSNVMAAQSGSIENDRFLTDFVWQWGQFLDHDVDLTPGAEPAEPFPIAVDAGDPDFDPFHTGTVEIGMDRSVYDPASGTGTDNPRQQINQITSFIDASNVYGSDDIRAAELRTGVGGKLKMSAGDLLPFNTAGLPNAGGPSPSLFLAGDVRANEQSGLTVMHTLFVREHNRLTDEIAAENPTWNDEQIYQQARQIVGAEMQAITYNEFLPALLGFGALDAYAGYQPNVNPAVSNIFSTGVYRLGHSMLSPELLRLDASGQEIAAGHLQLRDAFFNPTHVMQEGIDSILRGLAAQTMQEVDTQLVDDVRNFLFGPPGAGGFDLAALNIQRGRDHGLPSYNQTRIDFGLAPVTSFAAISSNSQTVAALESLYASVDDIDLWTGQLAEDHLPGASVGETVAIVLADQFERLRDGDRFWYENIFAGDELAEIRNTRLSDIIRRNSTATGVQDNVFFAPSVLTYQVDSGSPQGVGVRRVGDQVQIFDTGSNDLLAQQSLAQTEMIRVTGSAAPGDLPSMYTVLVAGLETLSGGVQVFGGSHGADRLHVVGTDGRDKFEIYPDHLHDDSHRIEFDAVALLSVDAAAGNDQIRVRETPAAALALYGSSGSDRLVGGDGDDLIDGGDDRDRIFGRGGNDVLLGGRGNDEIDGGAGDDWIFGNDGHDDLAGRNGHDMIFGGRGNDSLTGNRGSDLLDGGRGDDTMKPGVDNDMVVAAQGDDTMVGMHSHDMLMTDPNHMMLRDMFVAITLRNAEIDNDAALLALIQELELLDIL